MTPPHPPAVPSQPVCPSETAQLKPLLQMDVHKATCRVCVHVVNCLCAQYFMPRHHPVLGCSPHRSSSVAPVCVTLFLSCDHGVPHTVYRFFARPHHKRYGRTIAPARVQQHQARPCACDARGISTPLEAHPIPEETCARSHWCVLSRILVCLLVSGNLCLRKRGPKKLLPTSTRPRRDQAFGET